MQVDPAVLYDQEQYCEDCPLRNSPYVCGRGCTDGPAMVVGTAPGMIEEMSGIAFTGRPGAMLLDLLTDLGVSEERTYYTNVMKRRPVTADGEQRKPNPKECYKCGSHLVQEIVRNRPSVILLLGSVPLRFLAIGQSWVSSALSTVHGLPIPLDKFAMRLTVIPTYDPAYVGRKGGLNSPTGDAFLADLEEFARISREY